MTSLDIISFKKNIKDYINDCGIPKEVCRLVVKEIYEETQKEALEEALKEAEEREKTE